MSEWSPSHIRMTLHAFLSARERQTLHLDGFRQAAVLVPLIDNGKESSLLFTRRTEVVETHKGQISFPGGVVDDADRDPAHTALRETFEEVGIPGDSVETLGILDDLITPIGFVISPVVGFIRDLPEMVRSEAEVAEVFQIPLAFFAGMNHARVEYREVGGRRFDVWYYDTGRHVIWGATAKMIRMLMAGLGKE